MISNIKAKQTTLGILCFLWVITAGHWYFGIFSDHEFTRSEGIGYAALTFIFTLLTIFFTIGSKGLLEFLEEWHE